MKAKTEELLMGRLKEVGLMVAFISLAIPEPYGFAIACSGGLVTLVTGGRWVCLVRKNELADRRTFVDLEARIAQSAVDLHKEAQP